MNTEDVNFSAPLLLGGDSRIDLAATLYLPSNPDASPLPGLIVGHGAGGRRSSHVEFCTVACEAGFAVLALDFRGHGDSQGDADGPSELDINAAAEWLRSHPRVDAAKICYRGSSMGGFYGLMASSDAEFAAMILICPASETTMLDALDRAEDGLQTPTAEKARWDATGIRRYFERQNTLSQARLVRCPTFLIHVRSDEVVPFSHSLQLIENLGVDTTLLALEEGSHTSAQHDPQIHARSLEWLHQQLTSYSERI